MVNKKMMLVIVAMAVVIGVCAVFFITSSHKQDTSPPVVTQEANEEEGTQKWTIQETETQATTTMPETARQEEAVPIINIAEAEITLDDSLCSYTGEPVIPQVSLSIRGMELVQGEDYLVECTDNVGAGTAKAIITGMGEFTGTLYQNFTIMPQEISEATITVAQDPCTYNGKEQQPQVVAKDVFGNPMIVGMDFVVSYINNIEVGEAEVTVTGKGNYTGSRIVPFTIVAIHVPMSVEIPSTTFTYNGQRQIPEIAVMDEGEPVPEKEYEIVYSGDCINPGVYQAEIVLTGNYEGAEIISFTILPEGTEIKTVEATDQTSATVAWEPKDIADGYEIQYASSVLFDEAITETIPGKASSSASIAGLDTGRGYFFRIRTYVNNDAGTLYSEWSEGQLAEMHTYYEPVFALQGYSHQGGITYNYWLNVPQGATDRFPLVVYLHGDGEMGNANALVNLPQVQAMVSSPSFISLAPVANDAWTSNIPSLKGLIDSVADAYQVDRNRIYIWGLSRGGTGVWNMVNTYPDYFAAAVPVSNEPWFGESPYNFVHTRVRAIVGELETNNWGGVNLVADVQNFVNQINAVGGNAVLEVYPGQDHGTITGALRNQEILNWMLAVTG